MKHEKEIVGIIGLGRFGMALAIELCLNNIEVIVCDIEEKKVKNMMNYTDNAFLCDDTSVETLTSIGIDRCSIVVVCIGEDIAKSILTTLTVKNLGVKRVISKAINQEQGDILQKLGAEVVYPERDMAVRVAKKLIYHNVMDFLELNNDIEINEILIPKSLVGTSLKDSNFRSKYHLNIIAIDHDNVLSTEMEPEYVFCENDKIVVIGKKDNINDFKEVK